MPTYEYECGSCHRTFEVRQRISDPALTTCDVCGGPVHRLLSAAPFILKGEGWYVTDYPSESRKKARDAEKSSASSASSPPSSGTTRDKADKPAATPAKSDGAGTSGAAASGSTAKPSD